MSRVNDVLEETTEYWYDGVNEIDEKTTDNRGEFPVYSNRYYVHGVSYVDERLLMRTSTRPYYYVVDRMYNVRMLLDRAGSIVECYAYDSYGRPRIRESCGRGDLNQDSLMNSTDTTRFASAKAGSIWDPRADLDDDGDVDASDEVLYDAKLPSWTGNPLTSVTTAQAFSDVGNPYMFQGVPHFAIDAASNATEDKISVNHHRARFADCPTGRWITRDPLTYNRFALSNQSLSTALGSAQYANPLELSDRGRYQIARSQSAMRSWLRQELPGTRQHLNNLVIELESVRQYSFAFRLTWGIGHMDQPGIESSSQYGLIRSNPHLFLDPNGTADCTPWYGNWCGPGWSGGLCGPCDVGPPAPPIDDVDALCEVHDNCYAESGGYPNAACDIPLCLGLLGTGRPAGMTVARWLAMIALFCTPYGY